MEYEHLDTELSLKPTQISFPSVVNSGLIQIEEPNLLTEKKMEQENTKRTPHQPSNLFDVKEKYLAFRKQWAKLANEKKLTSKMMLFYNIARGLEYLRGFTPITNKVKLDNGMDKDQGLQLALDDLEYICLPTNKHSEDARNEFIQLFEGTIDDEFMTKVTNYMGST